MRHKHVVILPSLITACMAAACFFAARPAGAQIPTEAGPAMDAYNSAFLVQSNGHAYYTWGYQQGLADVQWGWGQDLDIYPLEDRYEYTHNPADLALVNAVLNSMLTSPSWDSDGSYLTGDYEPNADGWNDDIGWTIQAFTRGYQLTGNQAFLTEAEKAWNFVMSGRPGDPNGDGLDPVYGGIFETNQPGTGKCQLSNSSYVYSGAWLYEATGNASYLNTAEAIYAWERKTLVNTTGSTINSSPAWQPWQVLGCTNDAKGDIASYNSDNVYDNGGVIYAATELYRATGEQQYYNDALNIINHVYNEYHPTANPPQPMPVGNHEINILEDGGYQPQNYAFTRALTKFLTISNGWWSSPYANWLLENAQDAWNVNNDGLTWNNWAQAMPSSSDFRSMDETSAAAVWQQLPPPTMNLAGTYEIQNANSGLAVNVSGASTASGAEVIQYPFSSGQTNALWTFAPTSGGYYQINNVNSGLALNVSGGGAGGAGVNGALILQWPAQSMIPGNDQWMPVQNADGTFSFYNLFSTQALDVPGASTASNVQLEQWFGNSTGAQKFNLIQPSLNLSGTYEIQNANSGLALNVAGGSTANSAEVIQYPFSGGQTNAEWRFVPANPGYYRIQNVNSGLYLNVSGASTAFGAPIIQYSASTVSNDLWRVVQNPNGTYSFYNAYSTDALDVPNNSIASNVQLDQWGENTSGAQQFKLISQ